RFQIIVYDFERSRTVPSAERLRIGAALVTLGNIAVGHCDARAVQRDPASQARSFVPVNVTTIEVDIVRQPCSVRFIAFPKSDQPIAELIVRGESKLNADKPVVVCAPRRAYHRRFVVAHELWQSRRHRRRKTRTGWREVTERGRLNCYPIPGLRFG